MLNKHSGFFRSLLFISDLILLSCMWFLAYDLRFYSGFVPVYYDIPPLKPYMLLLLPILVIWGFIFRAFNLYRPRRISSHLREIYDISKACSLALVVLVATAYFVKKFEFSRVVFAYFWILCIIALSLSRVIFREALRFFRRRGYNVRRCIIVGDGALARSLIMRLKNHPELGLDILGLLCGKPDNAGREIRGKEIIGTYADIKKVITEREVDQVFIALPFSEMAELDKIMSSMNDQTVAIKIVPDFYHFLPFCGSVEQFEGLPVFNLQDSPLYGWNLVLKRLSDIFIVSVAIVITLPLMILIALLIKLSSSGPVLYKQKRAGLDGEVFQLYKFRTMRVDAEEESGPVWTKEDDPRRTRFGAVLRKASLDELPQFFNVLKGDMSIVGPRPEREEFINEFRVHVPRYMLRHKMKAGITGWAQINGWRGNTSIKKRIEYDLYYIEHWSLLFDLKIMWRTLWKGLIHKHAY